MANEDHQQEAAQAHAMARRYRKDAEAIEKFLAVRRNMTGAAYNLLKRTCRELERSAWLLEEYSE